MAFNTIENFREMAEGKGEGTLVINGCIGKARRKARRKALRKT
ncbi:hypothetical protein V6C42_11235 [Pseudoclostridium thermosuccinogenes]|nr:hypothetical protein [Pseudoclostridium thermosuccinogenes]